MASIEAVPDGPSTAPTTIATPSGSALNKQNHRERWPYGNYRAYYTFRPGSTGATPAAPDTLDPRLALLDPELFRGHALLDLGTNAGKIPLDALQRLGAARVLGVDLDPLLVADAHAQLAARGLAADPARIDFVQGDIMQDDWFGRFLDHPSAVGPRFDLVTLFSITKWLHLHHGDQGMLRLFRALYTFLPPGGVVVIEPQEWENYKRAVKRNKDLRDTFRGLQLRPPFEQEMQDAGFTLEQRIERQEGGFSRPLLVWRRNAA